jgi:hypothetical protein
MTLFPNSDSITVEVDVPVADCIDKLTDADRIEWVRLLCNSIQKPGCIGVIRDVVNGEGYND